MVKIPTRLDDLLPAAAMERMFEVFQHPELSQKVRDAMGRVGLGRQATPLDKVKEAWLQARSWLDSLVEGSTSSNATALLNATGRLIPAPWRGLPVAPPVAYGYARGAMSYQDVAAVERKAEAVIADTFPGKQAVWVSSVLDALNLLENAQFASGGLVIARCDAVRLPAVGDVRAMLSTNGRTLLEVGAANGVSEGEWARALNGEQQTLLLVSPNGLSAGDARDLRQAGVRAARDAQATVAELLADGCLHPQLIEQFGFPDLRQRLETGTDVVIVPLSLLLGGTAGALILGSAQHLAELRTLADSLGCRLDAAGMIASTIALQISALEDQHELGAASQLLTNTDNLKNRAERLAIQLQGGAGVAEAIAVSRQSVLGPSPWTRYSHASWGVRLQPEASLHDLQRRLRAGAVAQGVSIETIEEQESLVLDLRFIHPQSDHQLVAALSGEDAEARVDRSEPA